MIGKIDAILLKSIELNVTIEEDNNKSVNGDNPTVRVMGNIEDNELKMIHKGEVNRNIHSPSYNEHTKKHKDSDIIENNETIKIKKKVWY